MAPKFKLCSDCPTPGACTAAGMCKGGKATTKKKMYKGGMAKKSGYAKGGYVSCGASMKPGQKRTK
ncbi:MAG: hypothetical protein GY820_25345 [Gammaproteobacteria bacterium]|nr:hypothetical protein [Gammaproteobacteria bacterium]